MAIEDKREMKYVIVSFSICALFIFGSIFIKVNVIDVMYLLLLVALLIKYIYIKTNI